MRRDAAHTQRGDEARDVAALVYSQRDPAIGRQPIHQNEGGTALGRAGRVRQALGHEPTAECRPATAGRLAWP